MHPDCERILVSEEEIAARVKEAGRWLTEKFRGTFPVAVCNLKMCIRDSVDASDISCAVFDADAQGGKIVAVELEFGQSDHADECLVDIDVYKRQVILVPI